MTVQVIGNTSVKGGGKNVNKGGGVELGSGTKVMGIRVSGGKNVKPIPGVAVAVAVAPGGGGVAVAEILVSVGDKGVMDGTAVSGGITAVGGAVATGGGTIGGRPAQSPSPTTAVNDDQPIWVLKTT